MIPKRYAPTPPWETYEVVDKGKKEGSPGRLPFDADLNGPGDDVHNATGKMWLVAFHGWPKAKTAMKYYAGRKTTPLITRADKHEPAIWILKAKPSCWRLYFYVYQANEKNWIIYLHATCKKRNAQDDGDAVTARNRLPRVAAGFAIQPFTFPAE